MDNMELILTAMIHTVYGRLRQATRCRGTSGRDRGAISLEQVLWFLAAGISVGVVATIVWNKVKTTAETPINPPTAP